MKFQGYITKKEGLENLTLKWHREGKRNKENQHVTYLTNLHEWLAEQNQTDIKRSLDLERHDCLHLETAWHIKDEESDSG